MATLLLRIEGALCKQPILTTATNSSQQDFNLAWNYDGANYTNGSVQVMYSIDGQPFIAYTTDFLYSDTSAAINIPGIEWSVIKFKIRYSNDSKSCDVHSNELIIDIS